jgi:small subunit ribosomal protein S17e
LRTALLWRKDEDLGKVRTELVKRVARDLLDRYPDKFTTDFENNKKLVKSLTDISTTRLRNRVAGYATRLMAVEQGVEISESEE